MAAYAALVSLMNLIEQIQNHPRLSTTSHDKKQINPLCQNVCFLLDFIESYNFHGGMSKEEAEELESQIASAAHAAEDVIESHIVDQIHAGSTELSLTCLLDLQRVMVDMDSIKEKAMKVKEEGKLKDQQPRYSAPVSSSRPLTTGKTTMVGFDSYLIQLMDVLTGQQCSPRITSIAGMGGTGKTTLARNVYEHMVIMQHFHFRAWATISQEYSVKEILSELLSCKSTSGTVDELGEELYKNLSGRRYLLVLDDMWSIEVWDKIKFFFPDNSNRSRIIVTTRFSNMAFHCSSYSFMMNFLNEDNSWKLFREKAFGGEDYPPELEKIGKNIVEQCRGLPLSIVVIGGHLGKSSRRKEYWESVANDIKSILNSGEDEQCMNILSLSYSHLPSYLKPCFLYMGIFPEDDEIRVSTLIKLWVAEGFLKPNKSQSLEEVAEGYFKDLVDRNLILVCKWSRRGKMKTCNIHDLLRDLCLKVAEKEKFLYVLNLLDTPRHINRERRVAIHGGALHEYYNYPGVFHYYNRDSDYRPRDFYALRSALLLRSLMCWAFGLSSHLRLLKILTGAVDLVGPSDVRRLEAKFQQVNLRYLDRQFDWKLPGFDMDPIHLYLPSSISLIWNLQTLILRGHLVQFVAPYEIWEMPQLRHLVFNRVHLRDPRPMDQAGEQDDFALPNLQTLSKVVNFRLSEEVCKRIPNIKKLKIWYNLEACSSSYCFHNLGLLRKLESLTCGFAEESNWRDFLLSLTFLCSLQRLTLTNCSFDWEVLTIVGSLPHLEVLKLEFGWSGAMKPEWNPVAGGFLHLKSLIIYYCNDLIYWNADSSHFPVLENLVLLGAHKLEEVPSAIGEIPTLRCIELSGCRISAAISALRILVEQESLGNEGLQLELKFWRDEELESFREMVQLEGLTSNNLRLE